MKNTTEKLAEEYIELPDELSEEEKKNIQELFSKISDEDKQVFKEYDLDRQKKLALIFKLDEKGSLETLRDILNPGQIRELFGILDTLIENSDFGKKGRDLCKVGDKYLEDY